MIIYKVTNKLNNKVYIGQTTGKLLDRWHKHCSKSSECPLLSRAIKKYGKAHFSVDIIAEVETLEELNTLEIKYIEDFKAIGPLGYNLKSGGANGKFSESVRQKMSEGRRGSNNPNWGKKLSSETKAKISARKKGCLGRKKRPIFSIDLKTGVRTDFDSVTSPKDLGFLPGNIWSCCNGRLTTYKGRTWSYS